MQQLYTRKKKKPKITVLLSGPGGVRGIFSITILKEIEKRLKNKSLSDSFNLISGISSGAIHTALLTSPNKNNPNSAAYTLEEIDALYDSIAQEIFQKKTLKPLQYITSKGGLYDPTPLKEAFNKKMNGSLFRDLSSNLIIPAFNLETGYVEYMTNMGSKWLDLPIVEAVMATTAVPTLFPPHEIKLGEETLNLIDPGLANSSIITHLLDIAEETTTPENITFVYIGTTMPASIIDIDKYNKMRPHNFVTGNNPALFNMAIDANLKEALKRVKRRIGEENFFNFCLDIDKSKEGAVCPLDNPDPKNLRKLRLLGKRAIKVHSKNINTLVNRLKNHPIPIANHKIDNDNYHVGNRTREIIRKIFSSKP